MRTFDFSPLFRSTVGFDRVSRLLDTALQTDLTGSYPPYNIEKREDDAYRVTMAVAGFGEDNIEVTQSESVLVVRGTASKDQHQGAQYLHRGIAGRSFERRFQLADHITVTGASLENGLLSIDLVREIPEALKPRKIAIESGAGRDVTGQIEAQKAAA